MSGPAHDAARAGAGRGAVFAPPVAAALNHLLRGTPWACERLKPFCGKIVRFDLAPFEATLTILLNGEVEAATTAADASFALTPGVALRILAADPLAWREVQVSGDTELAREILYVAQHLRWDAEEDLSRVFGDIVAHRMVRAARDHKHWQRQAGGDLARSAAAYWTDEQPLLATRPDVERFVRDVDALRDDVARAEKRIDNLAACVAAAKP